MIPASVGFQCPECVREGQASVRVAKRGGGLQAAGRRWGAVTLTLIAINVAMFAVTAVSAGVGGSSPLDNYRSPVFEALSQWPYGVSLFGEWWRVFTAAFLHIGPVHLAMNMLALLVFGSELERGLGRWRFLALYLLSALGGSVAGYVLGPPFQPSVGASGAIFGLFGAYYVVVRRLGGETGAIVALLAINLVITFTVPNIDWRAHLGGLVTGALIASAFAYIPRGPRQAQLQWGAVVLIALFLVVAVVQRTAALTG